MIKTIITEMTMLTAIPQGVTKLRKTPFHLIYVGFFLTSLLFAIPVSAEGLFRSNFRIDENGEEVFLTGSGRNPYIFDLSEKAAEALATMEEEEESEIPILPVSFSTSASGHPLFSNSLTIRGQNNDSYWTAVQNNNNPQFLAQNNLSGASVADTAPSLNISSSAAPTQSSTVAPPLDTSNYGTLTPSSGSTAPPCPTDSSPNFFEQPVQTMKRFWEGTSFSYTFVPKTGGDEGLGIHDFDFNMQFNFPCKLIPHTPETGTSGYWYISPNFGLQLWNMSDQYRYKMPSQTFDASLAFGLNPQLTKDFGAELCFQLGVAASFKKVNCKSLFYRGRGVGTLRINEQITAIGGVIYYDRNHYKLLPTGGIKWVPNDKNEWLLIFPNPRLSHYLANLNETKWWGYLQGDIGGGRWMIKDKGETLKVDYNDYRVGLGLKFECPTGLNGFFEVGGAFGRELYSQREAWFKPKSAVYLKGGIAF